MPATVRDLPNLITTSTSSTVVGPIGKLDDASSITIFFASTATWLTSGTLVQVSQFDPFDPIVPVGTKESTGWYTVSTSQPTSTGGTAVALTNISFRGLRLSILGSGNSSGEVIAYVSKQISV